MRRKTLDPPAAILIGFLLLNITYVTAIANFLSSFENNRYRFPLDAFYVVLLGVALSRSFGKKIPGDKGRSAFRIASLNEIVDGIGISMVQIQVKAKPRLRSGKRHAIALGKQALQLIGEQQPRRSQSIGVHQRDQPGFTIVAKKRSGAHGLRGTFAEILKRRAPSSRCPVLPIRPLHIVQDISDTMVGQHAAQASATPWPAKSRTGPAKLPVSTKRGMEMNTGNRPAKSMLHSIGVPNAILRCLRHRLGLRYCHSLHRTAGHHVAARIQPIDHVVQHAIRQAWDRDAARRAIRAALACHAFIGEAVRIAGPRRWGSPWSNPEHRPCTAANRRRFPDIQTAPGCYSQRARPGKSRSPARTLCDSRCRWETRMESDRPATPCARHPASSPGQNMNCASAVGRQLLYA